ncbi:MAG: FecR domain-containing protein, partial [Psychroflexus sp.]|nr:FecR domain-containing protein [Psychroflexus sp.]
ELERLLTWLDAPENQVEFKKYIRLHHNLACSFDSTSSAKAFEKVQLTLQRKEKRNNYRSFYRYAAIFVLMFGILGITFFAIKNQNQAVDKENWVELELNDGSIQYIKPNQTTFVNQVNSLSASENEVVYDEDLAGNQKEIFYNTLRVPYGKNFSLVLSDGTQVHLNAGSSLRYPTLFSKDSTHREVFLNGEAYFDVTSQDEHSFLVTTEDLSVEVLGTQFNVTAYQEDQKAYAVLVEGEITAQNPQSESRVTVRPGQKVFYRNADLVTEQTAIQRHIAWIKGELVFVNDTFEVIQNKIERAYDVKIVNDYKVLNDLVISARFKDETIQEVLETFQTYEEFNYTIEGRTIRIKAPNS